MILLLNMISFIAAEKVVSTYKHQDIDVQLNLQLIDYTKENNGKVIIDIKNYKHHEQPKKNIGIQRFCDLTFHAFLIALPNENISMDNKKEFDRIMTHIYQKMDIRKLETIIFIAHALHNTTGFIFNYDKKDKNRYRSRGLLQIKGEENYKALDKLNKNRKLFSYVSDPEKYRSLSGQNIDVTIEYYKKFVIGKLRKQGKKITYKNTLDILNPEEVGVNAAELYLKMRFERRVRIYKIFVALFHRGIKKIKTSVTSKRKF